MISPFSYCLVNVYFSSKLKLNKSKPDLYRAVKTNLVFKSGFDRLFLYCRSPPTYKLISLKKINLEVGFMKRIKLKDEYYWYPDNDYIDVSDEVAEAFSQFHSELERYRAKVRYHRSFYSIDTDTGIDGHILFVAATPDEIYERKVSQEQMYAAINKLPETQARRIYAKFFQGISIKQIAKTEGVDESSVRKSIAGGLKNS